MSHHLGSSGSGAHNSVAERRLRPIYDWLNGGNNKKALQESDRILKKSSNFSCCKVLKSLALLRMGREEEATNILETVLSEGPTDEETLQAMAIAFKESLQLDKICLMYEMAIEKEPNNEDLLSHLFMSYVRIGDYKKQQQAAFALYKASPKNPYYFWAIMSILLYATLGKDKTATQFSFPLAQRMMTKMEKENKMKQEQETHLYLMVMEAQDKYKEALDILEGPLGIKLNEETSYLNFVAFKKIELLKKMERWEDVHRLSRESLLQNPDQWSLYLDYISSVFMLKEGGDSAALVQEANEFFIDQQTKNTSCRGPYLAQIELLHQQISNGEKPHDPIYDSLLNYIKLFGHKGMCFSDTKLYFEKMETADLKKMLKEATEKFIELDEGGFPKSVNDVCRHLFVFQIRRFTGEFQGLSVEDSLKTVTELLCHYSAANHLVSEYENTELKPSDMYIVLVGHFLWDLWMETRADRFFYLATQILEATLDRSPSNFHLRFLLIKFYNRAGAVACSLRVHEGLGLKHIQLDSLGYVVSKHAFICGHFDVASTIYSNTLKFFTRNHKDTVDHIISAYRCGSFDKIREFIKLRDRLGNSVHHATLRVESLLLELFTEASFHDTTFNLVSRWEVNPLIEDIPWEDLHDNRDFRVMVSFEPTHNAVSESSIRDNFKLEKRYLKCRSLVMRSIAAAVLLSEDIHPGKRSALCVKSSHSQSGAKNGESTEDKENNGASLNEHLLGALESILKELKSVSEAKEPSEPQVSILQGPEPSRAEAYLPFVKYYVNCLELVIAVHKQATESKINASKSIAKEFDSLVTRFKDLKDSQKSLIDSESVQQEITYTLEAASLTAILADSCATILKSSTSKKSKKKKALSLEQEQFVSAFEELKKSVSSSLDSLGGLIEEYKNTIMNNIESPPEDETIFDKGFQGLETFEKWESYVSFLLKDSYYCSFKQFLDLSISKVLYFNSLSL